MSGKDVDLNEMREIFLQFDTSKNGFITTEELGDSLMAAGEPMPGYKLRQLVESVDRNKDGKIDFDEWMLIYKDHSLKYQSFKDGISKAAKVTQSGGTSGVSAEGTMHSYSDAELVAFSEWINTHLEDDVDCAPHLPLLDHDLFTKTKDGIIACKIINLSVPGTIDDRAINKKNLNTFTCHENQTLAINSAVSIGCSAVNIGPEDLISGKKHLVLGLLWQIIRIGLFSKIDLQHCPNMIRLLKEGEELSDLLALSPEALLLRWFNYQLEQAGTDRRVNNFSGDIKDSEAYTYLLHQISPPSSGVDKSPLSESGMDERAKKMLCQADKIGCREFVTPADVVKGNPKLNMAFVANLFNRYPNLRDDENAVDFDFGDIEETREEKTFRCWMNSLGVDPYVNNLYTDLSDGLVLLHLFDMIQPGIVNWSKVNKTFKKLGGKMKKIENCNYVIELGRELHFSLVAIGGEDIHNEVRTLTLAVVWQAMRAYTLALVNKIDPSSKITDDYIIDWCNEKLTSSNKTSQFKSFKDSSLMTAKSVIDLIDSIKPNSIDYSLVYPGSNDEERLLNAKYAVSVGRRIGAKIYALPEDIVEVKPKMVLTIFACLMLRGMSGK